MSGALSKMLGSFRGTPLLVIIPAVMLLLIGSLVVYSSSIVVAINNNLPMWHFWFRQGISALVGLFLMRFLASTHYKKYVRVIPALTIVVMIMVIAVTVVGYASHGAQRWIGFSGFSFQPSEAAKLNVLLASSAYVAACVEKGRKVSLISWPVGVTAIMAFLTFIQPDMGTAAIVGGAGLIAYLLAGLPRKESVIIGGGLLVLVLAGIAMAGYRAQRIKAWLDPWSDEGNTGYQTAWSLMSIGTGGLFGLGLGKGFAKYGRLPESHTDFVFAVICQEAGFIGAAVVLILFALLAYAGLLIAFRSKDTFGSLLAAGITILILGQAIGNIAMVSNVIPVVGIPLPFISFGGSSLIVNCCAVGMLASVGRFSSQPVTAGADVTPDSARPWSKRRALEGRKR